MLNALGKLFAWPLLALVWLYRMAISPWLGNNCRYQAKLFGICNAGAARTRCFSRHLAGGKTHRPLSPLGRFGL